MKVRGTYFASPPSLLPPLAPSEQAPAAKGQYFKNWYDGDCPGCGNDDVSFNEHAEDDGMERAAHQHCTKCGAYGPSMLC